MRQTLTGLLQTGDPEAMDEAIRKAEGIEDLSGEVGALVSKQQAVLADGKLMLSRFAVPSTVYTAQELASIRAKYQGHASYLPEEWQLLEQAYHNALASERGGVAGVPLPGSAREARTGRQQGAGEALTGASFGLTVENSLAAAAELEHANSGLEEMLSMEGERRNEAERRLKAESAKRCVIHMCRHKHFRIFLRCLWCEYVRNERLSLRAFVWRCGRTAFGWNKNLQNSSRH
jgi:hypothetical protein